MADKIAEMKPDGLSIVGKTETENIGIEKIIQNVLAATSIRYLILCGKDSQGHCSGQTMLSLAANGIDSNKRVIGSKGKKPVLSNTSIDEVNAFRNQLKVIDLIECDDSNTILAKIDELRKLETNLNVNEHDSIYARPKSNGIETFSVQSKNPYKVKLDKAGYFVIVPKAHTGLIIVEHYSNDNQLLHIVKGDNARDLYWTIIDNKWVTELSHAAYLGKELAIAEMSINHDFKYIQDKA